MMFAVFLRATMMFDDVNYWPDRIYICQIRNKWHKTLWRIINSKIRMVTSIVTKNCEFASAITCFFFFVYQNIQRNVKSKSKKVKKKKKTPENVVERIIANINVVSSNDLFMHKVVSNYYSASS